MIRGNSKPHMTKLIRKEIMKRSRLKQNPEKFRQNDRKIQSFYRWKYIRSVIPKQLNSQALL